MKQAEKILKITYLEAKVFKSAIIGTEHLLLSILKDEDNVATKSIQAFNIDYDVAKEEFENHLSENGGAPLHVLTTPSLTVMRQVILEKILAGHPVQVDPQLVKETRSRKRQCWTTLVAT